MVSKASRRSPRFWTRSMRSSSSRDLISEPSCSWPRSFISGAILSMPRSRRWTWACSVFTKPQSRLSRSSASCVPSGATAPARMWMASSIPASASSSFQIARLSNSSRPGVTPNRAACSHAIAVCDDVSVLMRFCMILSIAMLLSSEAGRPVVMTLCFTRSQRSHDGRNACAGGMREWCGRRERSD